MVIDEIESSSSEEEQELGIHLFKNTSIQDVYQWFKDNGGTKKFRKIVTISGKMAARGINFVSADFLWHLTHMYYLAAKGTPIPELIQAMRICGIYKNCCIPLKVYSTEDTIWEIKKGYNIQKDILNRAHKNQKEISTKLWARDLKFNKGKIPKRQLAKGIKINKELKQVENSVRDGGMSYDLFERKIKNNISEDVWDEKYEHLRKQEEEYFSEEEEPGWEEEGGEWRKVIFEKLGVKSKNYYNQLVEAAKKDNNYGSNTVFTKSELLELASPDGKTKISLASTIWNWHADGSNFWSSSNGKEKGMHFKLEKNIWLVRVN